MFAKVFFGGSVVVLGTMYAAGMLGDGPSGDDGSGLEPVAVNGWGPYCSEQVDALLDIAEAHKGANGEIRKPGLKARMRATKIAKNIQNAGCDFDAAPMSVQAKIGSGAAYAEGWGGSRTSDWGS
ncbi:MAG: hypothetical protein AAGK01_03795 [Pseudomonadota bacterium]